MPEVDLTERSLLEPSPGTRSFTGNGFDVRGFPDAGLAGRLLPEANLAGRSVLESSPETLSFTG